MPEKRKNIHKSAVKSGDAEPPIYSGINRTGVIRIYTLWKKCRCFYTISLMYEGNASYYTTYSMCIIIPSIIGAACFQPVFRKLNNKGRTASIFALLTGISMLCMFFFNVKETPAAFLYTCRNYTVLFLWI